MSAAPFSVHPEMFTQGLATGNVSASERPEGYINSVPQSFTPHCAVSQSSGAGLPTGNGSSTGSGIINDVINTSSILPSLANCSLQRGGFATTPLNFQVPPVPKYSGNSEAEPFEDWLEQFELVASVCNWEGRVKLANLVTRLQGQAYSFYRTCPAHQRTSYESLTSALTKRFKPVRIKSVQSGLFHERKQQPKESVENYAQDLNQLYQKQKEEVRM